MEGIIKAINWPTAVLVLGVITLVLFRSQWINLIGRISKIGRGGIETLGSHQPTTPPNTNAEVENFMKTFDNPLLIEQESRISEDLRNRNILLPEDREKVLIRSLGATQVLLFFENIYNSIWGSQISLLKYLNSKSEPVDPSSLKAFYDEGKNKYPEMYKEYSFTEYVSYLKLFNLIVDVNGRTTITVAGKEFLKFLVDARKLEKTFG